MSEHISVLDALGSDPATIEDNAGPVGRTLIRALDKAVHVQSGAINAYINTIRARNPEASPAEIQDILDKHFMMVATGSGASAGAAAAIPGIGFFMGAAAVGAESLVFLDAASFYTVASAKIRGVDISDPERRRTLILIALLGSQGTAIVDAFLGEANSKGRLLPAPSAIARFSAPKITEINSRLLRTTLKQIRKRFTHAWVGKLMPLGVGAVLGTMANRKLATSVVNNTNETFGPLPDEFDEPAPRKDEVIDEDGNPITDDSGIIAKAKSAAGTVAKGAAQGAGTVAGAVGTVLGKAVEKIQNKDDKN